MNRPSSPLNPQSLQRAFLVAMAALFAVYGLLLCCGNAGSQRDLFYMGGQDLLSDMLNTEEYARDLDPYGFSQGADRIPFKDANYPPLAYVLFWLIDAASGRDITTPRAMVVALAFGTLSLVLLFLGLERLPGQAVDKRRRRLLALALAVSAPALFAFERGNIILLCAALCIWFLLGYRSPRPILRELSFIALAIAAALKVYPALLGLLLLRERRYREALRLAAYGAGAVFLPFLCMEGGFSNLPLLLDNFSAHTAYYTRLIYPRFGFRLFASITYDTTFCDPFLNANLWRLGEKLYRFMPWVDGALACCCLGGVFALKQPWERLAAIMLVIVNYPVNSGYYTALYLLPAIMLLLASQEVTPFNGLCLCLFLVVLNPVQIPIPYRTLGVADPILCNVTDILRNLAAYALFVLFAVRGVLAAIGSISSKRKAEPALPGLSGQPF